MFGSILKTVRRKTDIDIEKMFGFKLRKTKKSKSRRSLTNKKKIRIRERRKKYYI